MAELFSPTTHAGEVEIVYSPEEMLEKLHLHTINPDVVYSKLGADAVKLAARQALLQQDSFLYQLCEAVKNWKPQHDATSFTTGINQLIYLWLNAFEGGAQTDTLLNILKCFQLHGVFNFQKSSQFHLLLHSIFIESLNKYHALTLDHFLHYDENSQLPNEKQLLPNLTLALSQANNTQLTTLFSLHFKIKDHQFLLRKPASQDLNKKLAEILSKNIDNHSQLYFTGDFQFELLIPGAANTMQLDLLVAKIFRAFEVAVLINNQSVLLKPFIGCSFSEANQLTAHEIFHNAKLALEHALNQQKHYIVYSEELEQAFNAQAALESKVLAAFDSSNLTLNLQPILDLKTNTCVGAELLLHCPDKFGQKIPPHTVLEILNHVEKKGALFTHWLINTACRYAHEVTTLHQLDIYLTLNLRAEDLCNTELPALFSNALALWSLNPKHIILEITEKGILENNEHSNGVINALSELGFKFALDDFGTGFSSLTRLRTLPIDLIKIDQSFIKNIHHSKEDYEIVNSIAMLAKNLGKEVVAEGVEDAECLKRIKALKINKCQGYHFSKALPYEAFIEWIQAH